MSALTPASTVAVQVGMAVVCAVLTVVVAAPGSNPPRDLERGADQVLAATAPEFGRALALEQAGRWRDAYAAYARLADGGHSEAAAGALRLRRDGRAAHGMTLAAGPQQIARWMRVAECGNPSALERCAGTAWAQPARLRAAPRSGASARGA